MIHYYYYYYYYCYNGDLIYRFLCFLLNTASKLSAEYFPNKNIGAKLF